MDRRSSIRDGGNLPVVGAGNIDVLGMGCDSGGCIGWRVFRKGFVRYGNGCIECG